MSRPKSKPTDGWASLLQAEVQKRGTQWGPQHLTFKSVQAMLKKAGLPSGSSYTYRWLRDQQAKGFVKSTTGLSASNGRLVRDTRYEVCK